MGQQINVRLLPSVIAPLDEWIAMQGDTGVSRPEAIRRLLVDSLTGLGLIKHREDPEGAN